MVNEFLKAILINNPQDLSKLIIEYDQNIDSLVICGNDLQVIEILLANLTKIDSLQGGRIFNSPEEDLYGILITPASINTVCKELALPFTGRDIQIELGVANPNRDLNSERKSFSKLFFNKILTVVDTTTGSILGGVVGGVAAPIYDVMNTVNQGATALEITKALLKSPLISIFGIGIGMYTGGSLGISGQIRFLQALHATSSTSGTTSVIDAPAANPEIPLSSSSVVMQTLRNNSEILTETKKNVPLRLVTPSYSMSDSETLIEVQMSDINPEEECEERLTGSVKRP